MTTKEAEILADAFKIALNTGCSTAKAIRQANENWDKRQRGARFHLELVQHLRRLKEAA